MKLFNAFKDILEAAITNDGTQLGASIVNIIESSVDMGESIFGKLVHHQRSSIIIKFI